MKKAERLSTNYSLIKGLGYIDAEDLLGIELNAKALSLEDCFETLFIDPKELSTHESTCATMAHTRGRKNAIATAADCLFSQMKARNGSVACMEYLKQMAGTFSMDITPTPGSNSGFSFNVFMPDDPAAPKPSAKTTDGKD